MVDFNRLTFRPGGQDYSALAALDMDDLMPPDVRQELRGDFKEAGLEVTAPEAEPSDDLARDRDSGDKDGEGSAVFDGAPKPVPGDELAAVVYGREPDARSNIGLMVAAGAVALSSGGDDGAEIDTPTPEVVQQPDPMAGMEPHRGNYNALEAHHAAAIDANGLSDLMPANARGGFSEAGQEVTANEMDDLMPPDIRAEVDAANSYQQSQQQGQSLGL